MKYDIAIATYREEHPRGDVLADGDEHAWATALAEAGSGKASGTLSPLPLLIPAAEWRTVEAGVNQRAELLERVLADLYGAGALVKDGALPAAVVTGSSAYLRSMIGLEPPGGRRLRLVAFDLARDPGGGWRVLADHLDCAAGAGWTLKNWLAAGRIAGGLHARLNVERHAPFWRAFRDGLAASCRRAEPRIGLLSAGRRDPSHDEQADLARYLGFLLVEGADLAALDGRLYLRTIEGLKRVDALWRWVVANELDPLAFDARAAGGVAGLIDAHAAGELALANAPGAGVLESRAFAAFLPALATRMLGEALTLPNVATWWCAGTRERAHVEAALDTMIVGSAFGPVPFGLPDGERPGAELNDEERAALLADMARRPQDYVGREPVRRSTMPVLEDGALTARPFTLRAFAARDADGQWRVLPGGWLRIGEGEWSADVCVHGPRPVASETLLPGEGAVRVRRNPGTLPSRAADDLFWLGRYLERGEALLAGLRVLLGASVDEGADTVARLVGLVSGISGVPMPMPDDRAALIAFAGAAMEDPARHSVAAINALAAQLGDAIGERLSADMRKLLDAPFPREGEMLDRAGSSQRRYMALAGLSAEHTSRTAGHAFHDLGRRIERGLAAARVVRLFNDGGADELQAMLDLLDSQISYRQRYGAGVARAAAVDLLALDPGNPRGLAFQTCRIAEHLAVLPVLADDGMAEPQQEAATALAGYVTTARAEALDPAWFWEVERRLGEVSELLARRYFLNGAEPLRASAMVLG